MIWNRLDSGVKIPWHKVLVYDGANTSFGYLNSLFISRDERKYNWTITPDYEGDTTFIPTHWAIIETPKNDEKI
jgi:hypothetical protein